MKSAFTRKQGENSTSRWIYLGTNQKSYNLTKQCSLWNCLVYRKLCLDNMLFIVTDDLHAYSRELVFRRARLNITKIYQFLITITIKQLNMFAAWTLGRALKELHIIHLFQLCHPRLVHLNKLKLSIVFYVNTIMFYHSFSFYM